MDNEWIDIYHNNDDDDGGCQEIAFRYRGSFEPDTVLSADNIQWPDGTMAEADTPFRCGNCGAMLSLGNFTKDGVYSWKIWRD